MNNRLVASVLLVLATAYAQDAPTSIHRKSDEIVRGTFRSQRNVRHISRPLGGVVGGETSTTNAVQALAATSTIPTWTATSGSYTYQMVGTNPMVAQTTQSTTITTPIVPLILKFADGTTFDPTVKSTCSATAPTSLTLSSPVFASANYAPGGTSVGNTQ